MTGACDTGQLCPTLDGFYQWCLSIMGVPSADLPAGSPYLAGAFSTALATVNPAIRCVSALLFMEAVYNLAGDFLLNYCPDQADQTFFADARGKEGFNLTAFVPGVVSAAADVSTSDGLVVPDFFKNLTMGDLQNLKTPYGRRYLAIAQDYGPTVWGIS